MSAAYGWLCTNCSNDADTWMALIYFLSSLLSRATNWARGRRCSGRIISVCYFYQAIVKHFCVFLSVVCWRLMAARGSGKIEILFKAKRRPLFAACQTHCDHIGYWRNLGHNTQFKEGNHHYQQALSIIMNEWMEFSKALTKLHYHVHTNIYHLHMYSLTFRGQCCPSFPKSSLLYLIHRGVTPLSYLIESLITWIVCVEVTRWG